MSSRYKLCWNKKRACSNECVAYDENSECNCRILDSLSSLVSILEEIEGIMKDA